MFASVVRPECANGRNVADVDASNQICPCVLYKPYVAKRHLDQSDGSSPLYLTIRIKCTRRVEMWSRLRKGASVCRWSGCEEVDLFVISLPKTAEAMNLLKYVPGFKGHLKMKRKAAQKVVRKAYSWSTFRMFICFNTARDRGAPNAA